MKKRGSNGMGSIRQRPDGRWEARFTLADGRRKSVYGKTESEVTLKLRTALHDVDSGSWLEPSRLTVGEWLGVWLRDYQGHTSPRTVKTYADMSRLHIVPVIGSVRLSALSSMHVRRVINSMVDKGLSPNYIHHCHGVMLIAFRGAIEAGLLRSNPASGVKTPRIVRKPLTIVDRENIPAFCAAASKFEAGSALVFMLLTGLRASELRGLQWSDIDSGKMTIQRQLPCKGENQFIPPKYGSTRVIILTAQALTILRQQKKTLAEKRLAAGEKWIENEITANLVFRTNRGWYIAESVMHKTAHAIGAEIGLSSLHPHDLRHSYAVAALRSGVDVKTVQNNLGHKNAAMTLDVYAAYTTDAGIVGAEMLSKYLENALK